MTKLQTSLLIALIMLTGIVLAVKFADLAGWLR
jgi:hypothetical protein